MDSNNFPVDIQCTKIPEWLTQRGHIQVGWRLKLEQLEKSTIVPLIENLSNNKDQQLIPSLERHLKLAETDLTIPYHVCQDIFNFYSLKEGLQRDIFGKYSKPQVRAWSDIITQYQKDNSYIIGAAYNLGRLMKYELVYWRKQKERVQQQLQLITLKKTGFIRQHDAATDKFAKLCSMYGITQEVDLDREEVWQYVIQKITNEGINSMKEIVESEDFVKLEKIAKFYFQFTRAWHFGNSIYSENELREKTILPVLTGIFDKSTKSDFSKLSEHIATNKKHLENNVATNSLPTTIADSTFIQLVIDSENYSAEHCESQIKDKYLDPNFRSSLLNEFEELEFFLKQRHKEMELLETANESSFSLSDMIESTATTQALNSIGFEEVVEMLKDMKRMVKYISSTQIQQAYLVLSSNHFSSRLREDIGVQKRNILKISNKIIFEDQNNLSCTNNLKIIVTRIYEIVLECKTLKKMIELELKNLLKGREINIVGEINRL